MTNTNPFDILYISSLSNFLSRSDGNDNVKFDVIFGPAYKGIPLGAIVSSALYQKYGINVNFTYNRKEIKDHGEGGQLVGASMNDKRVLIIDDVITAGTAIRESYDLLMSVPAIPIGVVIALDRAEIRSMDDKISAVQAVERDLSIPVISIITLVELQHYLEQASDYDADTLQSVIEYRKEYGAM
jgi:orotate phosphoribosyltransferase